MRTRLLTTICLLTIILGLVATDTATAAVSRGDGLLIVNGGHVTATSALTESTVDGSMINLTYEKLDWNSSFSFGFNIGYASASGEGGLTDSVTGGSSRIKTSSSSVPWYVGAKYWLGKSTVQGYLGAALGVYIGSVRTESVETGETRTSIQTSGFGMGVPIGITVSLGKTVFINGNYTLNWLWDTELFKDDLMHAFNIGVGFRFPGN